MLGKERYFSEYGLMADDLFSRIGWKEGHEYNYSPRIYYSTVYDEYDSEIEVIAVVSEDKEGIIADGYIGISWMAVKALTDQPLAEYEISQLLEVMQEAEDILVDSGIPFMPDYKFHGKNRGRHKQRNDALRKRIGLNEFKRRLIKKEEE